MEETCFKETALKKAAERKPSFNLYVLPFCKQREMGADPHVTLGLFF